MAGLTLDTGALIALERHRRRIGEVVAAAHAARAQIVVPAPVVAEWWRGRTDRRANILEMVTVEPMDATRGKLAGEALASLSRRGLAVDATLTVDAIVMASAALAGHVVYTQDFDDLERFSTFFPGVRLLVV